MIIATVIVHLSIKKYFQYRVPNDMTPVIGGRVIVPFRSKELIGIVLSIYTNVNIDEKKYKFIKSIIDKKSLYTNLLLDILLWSSKYYHCPVGDVFFSVLPKFLQSGHALPKTYIKKWTLTKKGLCINFNGFKDNKKKISALLLLREKSILDYELKKYNISSMILQELIIEKLCKKTLLSEELFKQEDVFFNKKNIILNDRIVCQIKKILKKTYFSYWLLTKNTLFIKIKFYLGLIKNILEKKSQILIIVPYIKNIHRIVSLLNRYFCISIAIIHAQLTSIQYLRNWIAIKDGKKNIIIGTSESVFIPFFKLGLIIILEENSSNYKNTKKFRYNTRDIGILLGFKGKIPVILDSDTPSLKTLHNIFFKKCSRVDLNSNYFCKKIQQKIVDLTHEKIKCGLSQSLIEEIHDTIKNKKQILLIFNKLNFIFFGLTCSYCGWIAKCNLCHDYLEINLYQKIMSCKYCILKIKIPIFCARCKAFPLIQLNFGKKYIKNIIKRFFPNTPLICFLKKNSLKKNHENFLKLSSLNPCIIIITEEMVQNYFFPHVKLIGLICIDHYFYSTNFRFIESFSQFYMSLNLIVRDNFSPVKAVIQTSFAYHKSLLEFFDLGYFSFANKILKNRKIFSLPPWNYQITVYAQSFSAEKSFYFLLFLYTILKKKSQKDSTSVWLVGPYPDISFQYKKGFIYYLLIQHSSQVYLQKLLKKSLYLISYFSIAYKVKWFVKIDIE
ncbi:primosomal protein N' [Buchnera aphidicola]|uniref:replication restart helicase PriA n=1 Tax=Buchnera aphidicola TaxID=9 RepID=UPI0034645B5C